MPTAARLTLVLAALAAFSANEARGQTHLSFSVGVGSLFTGVGFGIGRGYYAPGSLFPGTGLGLGYHTPYDDHAYGVYSDSYDGRDRGYRGRRFSYSCWDYYWDSYWDPYSDWFSQCVAYRPWRYNSFRTRSWMRRMGGYYGSSSAYVYVRDAFGSPWGPYWAYDPWVGYWGGNSHGYYGGYYDGYYTGRVYAGYYRRFYRGGCTIYARGGRTTVVLNRSSPLIGERTAYKENPRTTTSRTAVRRGATTTTTAGPVRMSVRTGADTGRSARPSGTPEARRAGERTAPSGGQTARSGGRTAAPTRRPSAGRTGSAAARPGRVGGSVTRGRPAVSLTGRTGTRAATPRRGGAQSSSGLPSRNPVARPLNAQRTPPRAGSASDESHDAYGAILVASQEVDTVSGAEHAVGSDSSPEHQIGSVSGSEHQIGSVSGSEHQIGSVSGSKCEISSVSGSGHALGAACCSACKSSAAGTLVSGKLEPSAAWRVSYSWRVSDPS